MNTEQLAVKRIEIARLTAFIWREYFLYSNLEVHFVSNRKVLDYPKFKVSRTLFKSDWKHGAAIYIRFMNKRTKLLGSVSLRDGQGKLPAFSLRLRWQLTGLDLIGTLAHELRHVYQELSPACFPENSLLLGTCHSQWLDDEDYKNDPAEVDAETFASKVTKDTKTYWWSDYPYPLT